MVGKKVFTEAAHDFMAVGRGQRDAVVTPAGWNDRHERFFERVEVTRRHRQPGGENYRRAHQLQLCGVVPARAGPQAVGVVEVGDVGAIAREEVIIGRDPCQHDDVVAGRMPGIGDAIVERQVVNAAFGARHDHRVAQPQPGAQHVAVRGAGTVAQADLRQQVVQLLQAHAIHVADGVVAVEVRVPLLGLGDHLLRRLRRLPANGGHRFDDGAGKVATGELRPARLKLVDIEKGGDFARGGKVCHRRNLHEWGWGLVPLWRPEQERGR